MDAHHSCIEILNAMNDTAWIVGFGGSFLEVNNAAVRIFGYSREEFHLMTIADIDVGLSEGEIHNLFNSIPRDWVQVFETIHRTKAGKEIPVEISSSIIYYNDEMAILSIGRDITKRKEAQEELAEQLEEKELFLKEVHHRIKNNLASVEAFLNLQAASNPGSEAVPVLLETAGSVKSMQMIYNKLLLSVDYKNISVESYFSELIDAILDTYAGNSEIAVSKVFELESLDVKLMFPLGVIINELITNIMKHSFADIRKGAISFKMKKNDGNIILEIKNNGIEFPPGFDASKTKGFGIMIINTLCKQIGAELTMKNENGPFTRIIFPEAVPA